MCALYLQHLGAHSAELRAADGRHAHHRGPETRVTSKPAAVATSPGVRALMRITEQNKELCGTEPELPSETLRGKPPLLSRDELARLWDTARDRRL